MREYYPGDDYVDWLGMSAYGKQFRGEPWVSASDTMIYAYDDLCGVNADKPVMLAEWGIGEFPKVRRQSAMDHRSLSNHEDALRAPQGCRILE